MATRSPKASTAAELGSDIPRKSGPENFNENIEYMKKRYFGENQGASAKKATAIVEGIDVSSKTNVDLNPLLYAKAITRVLMDDLETKSGRNVEPNGLVEVDAEAMKYNVDMIYTSRIHNQLASSLAFKLTTELFNTVGGNQKEDSPFAIAPYKENGVRVDPMQMYQDIRSVLMQYASVHRVVNNLGFDEGEDSDNNPVQFARDTMQRIYQEVNNYGQYGKGQFAEMFDKAMTSFKSTLESPDFDRRIGNA